MNNEQNLNSDKSLPVYEAEIMEESDRNDIEKFTTAKPVSNKTSIVQKIGKTIGAIGAIAGLLSEFKQYLPYLQSKNINENNNRKQRRRLRSRG